MANRFWVGGNNTWNGTAGSKWSTTSGGAGGAAVPTSSDDVFFDANSGAAVITLSGGRNAKSLTCTGFTGTFDMGGNSDGLSVFGNIVFVSGMTLTSIATSPAINIAANAQLTCAGKTIPGIGMGGNFTLTLQDDLFSSTYLGLTNGTFNTNNFNVTCPSIYMPGNNATTVTLGSSLVILTGTSGAGGGGPWECGSINPGNITLTANTATIKYVNTSNTATSFGTGDKTTYHNIWFDRGASTGKISIISRWTCADFTDTGTAAHILEFTNSNTYTMSTLNITGNGAGNEITLQKNSGGTAAIFSIASGIISCDYIVANVNAAGGATFYAGAHSSGSGSGWIFTAVPAIRYWVGGSDAWDGTAGTKWALSSGGAGGAPVPSASDDVFFDAVSGAVTVTKTGSLACKDLDFTGFTGTLAGTGIISITGAILTLGSGMTWSSTGVDVLSGAIVSLTSNGKTIAGGFTYDASGGVLTIEDALSVTGAVTLTQGTFDANDQTITVGSFHSSNSNVRTILMGSGLWTLTSIATVWELTTTNNLTFTKDTANIKLTNNSASAKVFAGGSLTYNDVWIAVAGAGITTISGSNTFDDLKIDTGIIIEFTDGTTQVVTTFTAGAGAQRILRGTGTGNWTISAATGTISVSNSTISYSQAVGGATFEAFGTDGNANGGNNSGWIFSFAPLATVITNPVTDIEKTTALGHGEVTDDGGETITERGFVWSINPSPTTADNKLIVAGTIGGYSGSLTSLTPGTLYYVRAYAMTIAGTGYGDNVMFTTKSDQARVGALDTSFLDYDKPIYFDFIDRWRSYTDLYAKVESISGFNIYTENAAGARVYFQEQKSPPNVWGDPLGTVDEKSNSLFPNAQTMDYNVGRIRVSGFSSGTPIVIHSIEILSVQDKGFESN